MLLTADHAAAAKTGGFSLVSVYEQIKGETTDTQVNKASIHCAFPCICELQILYSDNDDELR